MGLTAAFVRRKIFGLLLVVLLPGLSCGWTCIDHHHHHHQQQQQHHHQSMLNNQVACRQQPRNITCPSQSLLLRLELVVENDGFEDIQSFVRLEVRLDAKDTMDSQKLGTTAHLSNHVNLEFRNCVLPQNFELYLREELDPFLTSPNGIMTADDGMKRNNVRFHVKISLDNTVKWEEDLRLTSGLDLQIAFQMDPEQSTKPTFKAHAVAEPNRFDPHYQRSEDNRFLQVRSICEFLTLPSQA